MTVFDLWQKATCRSMCRDRDCKDCEKLYGIEGCPNNTECSLEDAADFVQRVSEKLLEKMNEDIIGITEDEFVNILLECEQ